MQRRVSNLKGMRRGVLNKAEGSGRRELHLECMDVKDYDAGWAASCEGDV